MEEVIDFYDAGGGAGKGIAVNNQTLPADSLRLTVTEKKQLIAFINSLSENIPFETPPQQLPLSKSKVLNQRKPGGEY
jgi:cytochrome c peroxidase